MSNATTKSDPLTPPSTTTSPPPQSHSTSHPSNLPKWHLPTPSESGTEADDERPSTTSTTSTISSTSNHLLQPPPTSSQPTTITHPIISTLQTPTQPLSASPSASNLLKSLPAPPARLRKGLKTGEKNADVLLTPAQLDDEEERRALLGEERVRDGEGVREREREREKVLRRRWGEFGRRLCEVGLIGVVVGVVGMGEGVLKVVGRWSGELVAWVVVVVVLVLAYPVKLSIVDARVRRTKLWERFRVPASFDPATVLYPPVLPVLVALSVAVGNEAVVLPNIVLGLASLPQRLFPRSSRLSGFNTLHWLVAVIPVIVSEYVAWPRSRTSWEPYTSREELTNGLTIETLVSLYPLHHALMVPLHYLTKTSLLMTELHLLSAAMINLLLLAASPQTTILKACLWIGGTIVLALCGPVLSWNIILARVPKWKFRRPGHPNEERKSLIDAVSDLISLQRAAAAFNARTDGILSDGDDDEPFVSMKRKTSTDQIDTRESNSTTRRSSLANGNITPTQQSSNRKSSRPLLWCLRLTTVQARRRKWLYGAFTYATIIITILGPVRSYISRKALFNTEAVGWAISYLLSQLPFLPTLITTLHFDTWIPLPPQVAPLSTLTTHLTTFPLSLPTLITNLGPANTRLLLLVHWLLTLLAGLTTVFSLTKYVEVDTRRKVFHGVMVVMLLPSIFIDPCFCSLALTVALTLFLVLEVLRAGQVQPLADWVGRFVAPYVDGRDLRGPVVVSHIFLLVGCAVPLWFSLAGMRRDEGGLGGVWRGWETEGAGREVAMVAGVVCVGMGDAAASLFGRRYGRRKWVWVGGKSLEGSAAFVVAVTGGLLMAKIWLCVGGWRDLGRGIEVMKVGLGRLMAECIWVVLKAVFCACGAGFMEAVLTGANDNVVVPVALWLLVKGVSL